MKFLCMSCDEAMKLKQTRGPNEGSFTVVFECPSCGWATAMLTNSMETQMVRSLGVKIGGRTVPAGPMEMVRNSLAHARDDIDPGDKSAGETSESKCPFTGVINDAYANSENAPDIIWTKEAEERMARIPPFAQPMARKGVEMHAREHGYAEIDDAVLDEVKDRFGM